MRSVPFRRVSVTVLGVSIAALASVVAGADESPAVRGSNVAADSDRLEEVVVSATRRETGAQSAPLALTAISGEQLAKQGIVSATQLNQIAPSLYIQSGVYEGSTRYSIRGLSTNDSTPAGTSPVALYIDDVYQASLFGTGPQLFDLQRVEILRGPQGTLFGKNTTGGAVSYFSRTPTDELEGYTKARAEWGDRGSRNVEGAVNVPIAPGVLASRVSFQLSNADDSVDDEGLGRKLGGSTTYSGRAQLRWTPDEDTRANLALFGSRRRGDPPLYHANLIDACNDPFAALYMCSGGVPKPAPALNPDSVAYDVPVLFEKYFSYGATLRLEHRLPGLELTSITGYRRGGDDVSQNDSGGPGDLFHSQANVRTRQISEEVRVASDAAKRLSGLLGLYAERDTTDGDLFIGSTQAGPPLDYVTRAFLAATTTTYAAFGNLTWKWSDRLSLIAGLRYSRERRSDRGYGDYFGSYDGLGLLFGGSGTFDWTQANVEYPAGSPPVPPDLTVDAAQARTWNKVTWDATASYQMSSDVMLYAKIATGFRSGGFSLPTTFTAYLPPPFEPENLRSYEAGIKSDFLDGRLRVNASAYRYNFTDQQVFQMVGGNLIVTNAGQSKVDGGELEVTARPLKALRLSGTAGYANAHFVRYTDSGVDYSGNRLQQAPRMTLSGAVSYDLQLPNAWALTASTDWSYRSRIYFEPNNNPLVGDGSSTIGNARLTLTPGESGLSVAAFVQNLTDRRPVTYAYSLAIVTMVETGHVYGIGRTAGIEVGYNW